MRTNKFKYNPPDKFNNRTHFIVWKLLKKYTQYDIARKVGVPQCTVSTWATGQCDAYTKNYEKLEKMAAKL